ncbi:MAG: hypothetical protein GQ544_03630, partial [Candidatus Aminicenantes bacterium]|nr:hypothetical protein [Candidatus Aminicenantes bacterium]
MRVLQGAPSHRRKRRLPERLMKVAVDVMGGDFGPSVIVSGALSASREY